MKKYKFRIIFVSLIMAILFIGLPLFFNATPVGKGIWNRWFHAVQTVDDRTNYQTRKTVEDTCRSMISTYTADKLTYEQYADSKNEEERKWAEQAKMRANRTASSYNNYILKNRYVWREDVPNDIYMELSYLN